MTTKSWMLTNDVRDYVHQIGQPDHPVLRRLIFDNAEHRLGEMSAAPEEVKVLTWIARLMDARRYLEIGVFTGYSSTAMALAMPSDATITCCDVSVTFTEPAQEAWKEAGVRDRITLYVEPALIVLNRLLQEGEGNSYDLAFIDADKEPVPHYIEACLKLVRPGGVIVVDNVLSGGRVLQPPQKHEAVSVDIMRRFKESWTRDSRWIPMFLPLGDGLAFLWKR